LNLGATDRGRIERIDLTVLLDQSGLLPDAWQLQYFGNTGVDPLDDPDGDGVNNLDEYRAGTHPLDPDSLFEVKVAEDVTGGPRLEWPSASGRRYVIQRSQDIDAGFEVLVSDIEATPPLNVYQDGTATAGTYFYRVRVDLDSP
jgi:hypothetical protein